VDVPGDLLSVRHLDDVRHVDARLRYRLRLKMKGEKQIKRFSLRSLRESRFRYRAEKET
jgi:hypothetical protein